MSEILIRWVAGGLVAIAVAALARWRRSLTPGGAVAASAVGAIVVGAGGWWWGVVLVAFFASSSALSMLRRQQTGGIARRGHERDSVQVVANGGVATAIAAAGLFAPAELEPARFALFCGSVASVNADTWATEIGRFSRTAPRLITSGRPVVRSASGGVTPLGTAGSLLGAMLIGTLAALGAVAGWAPEAPPWLLPVGTTVAGLLGSLLDSLVGATAQASYREPGSGRITEQPFNPSGVPNELVRGHAWVDNDLVNLAASVAGAAAMGLFWLIAV
jgi:uncharacterized protein (TIGR00297 family)